MKHLDTLTLAHLRTFLDDRDAPPQPQRAVAEALDRYHAAVDLHQAHRQERMALADEITRYRHTAPDTIVDRLATGRADLDDLTAHLDDLTARQERMAEQSLWLDRTLHLCARRTTACLADHVQVLVPYIAGHRARLPLTHDVPPYIAFLWSRIARRVQVWFPPEACIVESDQGARLLPAYEALTLGRSDRHRWAWAAIYLGSAVATDRGGVLTFQLVADWAERAALVDMAVDPAAITTPPTSLPRRLGVARTRRAT